MRHRSRSLLALGAAAVLSVGTLAALGGTGASAATASSSAIGLDKNGGKLTLFDLRTAKRTRTIGNVVGLSGDTKLIGIDFRVQDHRFYGVGNQGGVYTINRTNGNLTKASQLSVPLDGSADFAVDFNPAADRLRVISAGGQNLRHDLNTDATIADTPLAYVPAGSAPAVTAAAYTNNDLDAAGTATTLFDLDTTLDQVALQSPANAGSLVPTGKLGLDASAIAGFDILSTVVGGRTTGNTGYAALRSTDAGTPSLYRIDLLSGKATRVGVFQNNVADLAVTQP